ncbi:MAG: HAMP domain-containing sensor histidine kinase [Saprospiraceae bacterium]|nr:HAMP domain-containing sensor histidine kinase [Saprospiraceae bacterium]
MPLKTPRLLRELLRSASQYRIVWYFILGIVVPGVVMGILAFRGIRNDQALAEREQRRLALQEASGIIDTAEWILGQREARFTELIGGSTSAGDRPGRIAAFVEDHPDIVAAYRITPSGVRMAAAQLLYIPDDVDMIDLPPDQLVAREPPTGWTLEYQHQQLEQAIAFYRELSGQNHEAAVRAMACNALARLAKKRATYQEAVGHYALMRDSFADFRLAQSIPFGLTASAELCALHFENGDQEAAAGALRDLLADLSSSRWPLKPPIYTLFSQKAAEIYGQLNTVRDALPPGMWTDIDRLLHACLEGDRLTGYQLDVFHYLTERAPDLLPASWMGTQVRQSYEADGWRCIISLVPSAVDTTWAMLTSAESLVTSVVEPLLVRLSVHGGWAWTVRDARQPSGPREVTMPERDMVEVRFPAYLPHLTLVGTASPVSFMGSMLRSGRGGYLYIFLFIGAMFITGLLFVVYSVNRELQLNQMKSEFVATVSHEFKSPLTAIRQMTEMLQQGRVPEAKRDTYYSVMLQQGSRLTQLIDNILDFSRIEQGKKKYRLCKAELAPVISRSVARARQRYGDAGFVFDLEVPPHLPVVQIDEEAMAQVIDNLLDNAVKYSGSSRQVSVRLSMQNGSVQAVVHDLGIGIPEKDQQRVFERFYRVESEQHKHLKGSGIGLHLVREIIAAHGGTVRIGSTPGQGTKVVFELPADESEDHE